MFDGGLPMTSTDIRPATDPESYLDQTQDRRMASLFEFLRIPSISALSAHAADSRRAAEAIATDLRGIGMEHVEVAETGAHPVVYADWLHADGAPIALVYCHYDVQPVDPLELWLSPPFEPTIRDGRIVARGASDDKGQLHMHLRAIEALMETRDTLPLNVKVLFEGDEESSPAHLDDWVRANRMRLAADVGVISDTGFFEGNLPSITIGTRGIIYVQIDVKGPATDLHSGAFGGVVENPAIALAHIVAGLKAVDGRILIPGFYDDVLPLSADERAALAGLPFDDEAFRRETEVPALAGEPGYLALERLTTRPTLDVNGMWAGFQGEGTKTIIPAHAHAKISCRLVPNQTPEAIFERLEAHVLELSPPGVTTRVQMLEGGLPYRSRPDHPAMAAASRAVEAAFGVAPMFIREGGSIPVLATLERELQIPLVLLGFANPDDHAHAPNEGLVLDNYENGIRAIIRFWDELGATDLREGT
jgi:acetylornithine deacetylase/succinyl-diaminopimelate desuccinylase-like protein